MIFSAVGSAVSSFCTRTQLLVTRVDSSAVIQSQAERRRNRTYQRPGYGRLPVLKTGWGTSPVPLRNEP